MSNHSHSHSHSHNGTSKNILIACILNFSFSIFELIGGILTGSSAILSDAIHDFGDSLSLFLSLVLQFFTKKAPTKKYTYGFSRLSVIGAIINIIVLSFGTIFIIITAINKLINPTSVVASGMFFMSIFGILVNLISVIRMHGSINILDKSVALHLLEDLLGWIAVAIVSIVIYFTDFYFLDPILSLIISIILIKNIYTNLKDIINIIMQALPNDTLYSDIQTIVLENNNIINVNKLNIWTLDGENHIATMSVNISDDIDISLLKNKLNKLGVNDTTVETIKI